MNITRHSRVLIRNLRYLTSCKISRTSSTILKYYKNEEFVFVRNFSSVFSKSPEYTEVPLVDLATFEPICAETLETLTEYFEEIVEADEKLVNADISYSDGVLTVKLGNGYGTYVINRQTPNRQIWLSSPKSGPKRYDLIDGKWIYKHDGVSMYQLLQEELEQIMSKPVDFLQFAK
ncbi:hypothetical protein PVAND_005663 [Polypedilum vanderplanki]|uniref:ferroxidase n=1 Tax=Polypedilum vanderplanki TaxID=319348 RepID=A0A9J6C1Q3_POLVA|nr:hypothetical protein PVAND_005663 [Polypedilum vanderplanki]